MAVKLIMKAMEWIWRFIWLNLIWFLFSLAIVTIIPSTFAMFTVANKWFTEDNDIEVFPAFFKAFKRYFFKSYLLGGLLLIIGLFLYLDLIILQRQTGGIFLIAQYAFFALSLIYIFITCYCIPVFIHLEATLPKTFMIAFVLALRQPVITIVMLCGIIVVFVVFLVWTGFGILFVGSMSAAVMTKAALFGFRKYNLES
ncbi:putative membrane protein YesL [Pullulanibacillus pueri]|uniref:DUF624 domain-containing protein n=1 Tax=Pullulanibacillus pueri TaxID=1437324 RepID=A0A8J3EN20_9BACL|nr:DUF624 domain-containing protein [Pullulanibacillus pueri]MBM7682922.1 putative membrane protein YesL [Pullulanibacillus pueri]GGH84779.1 hypothetical protein GCM10007096_28650 [Pullulanibacillus pueri]